MAETQDAAPSERRNTALSDALQTQDIAAVAFALRHGPTAVPVVRTGDPRDADEVWTYRDPETGEIALLLFSDTTRKPETLPKEVAMIPPTSLRTFLETHQSVLTAVFLDIAGPHPMRATPADLIAALDA